MNLKMMRKKIIGVAFLVLAFYVVGSYSVYAEGCGEGHTCCSAGYHELNIDEYGITIEDKSDGPHLVYKSCIDGVSFNVSGGGASSGTVLSCSNNDIKLNFKGADEVTLNSTGPAKASGDCWVDSGTLELYATAGTEEHELNTEFACPNQSDLSTSKNFIDCPNNKYTDRSGNTHTITKDGSPFQYEFCYAYKHADYKRSSTNGKISSSEVNEFKCEIDYTKKNPETGADMVPLNPDELEYDATDPTKEYFVNKKYMWGKQIIKDSQEVVQHLDLVGHNSTQTLKCEITCQEAVVVEYGPPVASVAGACFEYVVRVTSRVSCNMSKVPDKVKCTKNACTPRPSCTSGSGGGSHTQGGPNEEFDACIQECDGGNYTKKCNTKCYKQVYGVSNKASAVSKTLSEYYDDVFATKLFTGSNPVCKGYYSHSSSSGSSCYWTNYSGAGNTAGRWYCENEANWCASPSQYEVSRSDGFFRRKLAKGGHCNDSCGWYGCEGKYVNKCVKKTVYCNKVYGGNCPTDKVPITSDFTTGAGCKSDEINIPKYEAFVNAKIREDFVKKCENYAKCSTETAEFTFDVKYKNRDGIQTIYYPYNHQKDTVRHSGGSAFSTAANKNTTFRPDIPSAGKGFYGCYSSGGTDSALLVKDAREEEIYRATWSFPHAWQNIKTGEYSYDSSLDGTLNWYKHNNRFCIPADAVGYNVLWYQGVTHKKLLKVNSETSASNSYIKGLCKYTESSYSVLNFSRTVAEDEVDWNIIGHAKKFGFLHWNIDIKCLFGMNTDLPCGAYSNDKCEETNKQIKTDCTTDSEYRVHTVDTENPFPDPSGSESTREDVGYNWSQYAINNKNSDYPSNPPAYLNQIMSNASSTYDANNLDYWFYLSPQNIRKLRNSSTAVGAAYTDFSDSGFKMTDYGISRYTSSKIRDGNLFPESKIAPATSVAIQKCNNMINYQNTSSCDSVHG